MQRLPHSGSQRIYYRMFDKNGKSFIKTVGTNILENEAFIYFSNHFLKKGLPVPKVYAVANDKLEYEQEDLGDLSLFEYVNNGRQEGNFSEAEQLMLDRTIRLLPHFQIDGAENIDWSYCYPTAKWDAKIIGWDLNYFKYCFLKNTSVEFNEYLLDCDFETLTCELMQSASTYFLYRDFQSRNVMIFNNKPYLIDFQGGRKGPVYYDVVSFLWQSKLHLPDILRQKLIHSYFNELLSMSTCPIEFQKMDISGFVNHLKPFILFRSLQVLGAYGFRGLVQGKLYFREAINDGIANLKKFFAEHSDYSNICPYLAEITSFLNITNQKHSDNDKLQVTIYSFSYRNGIPADESNNGGGYVFDCRGLNNPGRLEEYKDMTGLDSPVIRFIEQDGGMETFLKNIYPIIDMHINVYIKRDFKHLQISFGCTGGQHRSVYAAEHTASHIKQLFNIKVQLVHRELNKEKIL